MDIAIYGRVSTEDKGQDHENQFRELKRFSEKQEYNIVAEYVDYVSASGKVIRPQFQKMFEDARKRKFDLILFWSLDRFSREGSRETSDALHALNDWGVGWKSYTEQYLDSTGIFREAIVSLLAAIAKQERVRLGERVRAGMQTAKLKGIRLGRKKVTDIGRKRKGRNVPTANLEEISRMRAQGNSLREIAQVTGISKDSIARLLSQNAQHDLVA